MSYSNIAMALWFLGTGMIALANLSFREIDIVMGILALAAAVLLFLRK